MKVQPRKSRPRKVDLEEIDSEEPTSNQDGSIRKGNKVSDLGPYPGSVEVVRDMHKSTEIDGNRRILTEIDGNRRASTDLGTIRTALSSKNASDPWSQIENSSILGRFGHSGGGPVLEPSGCSCENVKIDENQCKTVKIVENPWKSTET